MEIFISWHGKKSHAVAEALRDWLPLIVNAFKPWISSADIDKGSRWRTDLATRLGNARAGIFCLTPSNLTAPWLLFEAGAISKASEKTYVCTLLVGLQPSDVTDPLAQFQATKATKEDLLQLVKNLNKGLVENSMEDAFIERAFAKWWPDLEKELKNLPSDETAPPPQRPDRALLEELVELTRAGKAEPMYLERFGMHLNDLVIRVEEISNRLRAALPIPGWPTASASLDTLNVQLVEAARLYHRDPEKSFYAFQNAAEQMFPETGKRGTQSRKPQQPEPDKERDKGKHLKGGPR